MLKLFLSSILLFIVVSSVNAQTYFSEDFEAAFTGTPPAPPGWSVTQKKTILHPANEKEWNQNTWNGSIWSIASSGNTNAIGPKSGSNVLWIDDYNFIGSSNPTSARRMESPVIDLSASVSPYIRFWYFNSQSVGQNSNFRVVASSDGGVNWFQLAPILNGWDSVASKWNRINVKVPAAYRTANFKFGFELTNRWGTANPFVDLVSVEEYTPATITSAATGNWNAPATWVGGVPPTSDNNVVISAGTTVTIPAVTGLVGRSQNLQVDGTLTFSTTTSTAYQAFGDITVSATGRINAYNGTSGRTVFCGGNFTNLGAINFAVGNTAVVYAVSGIAAGVNALVFFGAENASFTSTGTIDSSSIKNLVLLKSNSTLTINSPLRVTLGIGLYDGTLDPNGNLTYGGPAASSAQTMEVFKGSFSSLPTFDNTRVTQRNVSFIMINAADVTPVTRVTGNELEQSGGYGLVTGTLLLNTFNNIQLGYPVKLGTTTTGGMTLTKGILITSDANYLWISSFVAPPSGVNPTTTLPSTSQSQGAYVAGPIRVDMPTSTATRNFPLGSGTNFIGAVSSNVLKVFSLTTTTAWTAGTSVTVKITGKPSGSPVGGDPATAVMGTRSYYLTLNGGPDLPSNAVVTLSGNNYTNGDGTGSDSLAGNLENLRVMQSTSLTGSWTTRSVTSGTGAIVNNTAYARASATVAPGPIAPIATNGGYFAWGTTANTLDAQVLSIGQSGASYVVGGSVIMTDVIKNAGISPTVNSISVRRTISGTSYNDVQVVPVGLAAGATANVTFADFTGWVSGNSYTVRDSCYMTGDSYITNDTLSSVITPLVPQPTFVYYGTDTRSRDSIVAHFTQLGITAYDLGASLPNISLSNWSSVVVLTPSGFNFTSNTVLRDSLKAFLDAANSVTNKKSLALFGNDIGYYMDPVRNVSATAADTVFYRQYLRAKYIADDWVDVFVSADSTVHGVNSFSGITTQRVTDVYPDLIVPAMWNEGSGVLRTALVPVGSNYDSCSAVSYVGQYYNVFFATNYYFGYYVSPDGRGSILNAIKTYFEGNNGVLPVELSSFTASANGKDVLLNWETKSEINSHKFIIQRSVKENEWVNVAEINAAGNSSVPIKYSYKDKFVKANKIQYRLVMVDIDGSMKISDVVETNIALPSEFMLSQNYPNPFNPSTKIEYQLPVAANVTIEIFSITGERVARLLNSEQNAGYYTLDINSYTLGKNLSSGVYVYRMTANSKDGRNNFVNVKKMMMLK